MLAVCLLLCLLSSELRLGHPCAAGSLGACAEPLAPRSSLPGRWRRVAVLFKQLCFAAGARSGLSAGNALAVLGWKVLVTHLLERKWLSVLQGETSRPCKPLPPQFRLLPSLGVVPPALPSSPESSPCALWVHLEAAPSVSCSPLTLLCCFFQIGCLAELKSPIVLEDCCSPTDHASSGEMGETLPQTSHSISSLAFC